MLTWEINNVVNIVVFFFTGIFLRFDYQIQRIRIRVSKLTSEPRIKYVPVDLLASWPATAGYDMYIIINGSTENNITHYVWRARTKADRRSCGEMFGSFAYCNGIDKNIHVRDDPAAVFKVTISAFIFFFF